MRDIFNLVVSWYLFYR